MQHLMILMDLSFCGIVSQFYHLYRQSRTCFPTMALHGFWMVLDPRMMRMRLRVQLRCGMLFLERLQPGGYQL